MFAALAWRSYTREMVEDATAPSPVATGERIAGSCRMNH